MIGLVFGGVLYTATLVGCYDGDTCKLHISDAPAIVATVYVRIDGVDTPEIRGRCEEEKRLALRAADYTRSYFLHQSRTGLVHKLRDRYGRMVVEFPDLVQGLIRNNLGRPYNGGKRQSWCD